MKDISLDHSDLSNPNHLNFNDVDFIDEYNVLKNINTELNKEIEQLKREIEISRMSSGQFISMVKQSKQGTVHICPQCQYSVRWYRRRLNKGQVLFIKELYRRWKQTKVLYHYFDDIKDFLKDIHKIKPTDYIKLVDMHMIHSMPNDDKLKESSGYFCLTKLGASFVDGLVEVPSYIDQYNNETFNVSKDMVGINHNFKKHNKKKDVHNK